MARGAHQPPRTRSARASSSANRWAATERVITWTRAPSCERDLRGEVGGGAEPVDAEAAAGGELSAPQRAVPDDPGAQQRRGRLVVELGRDGVREGLVDHGVLRVTAVGIPPGELGLDAQVLVAPQAEAAPATRVAQPGDADSITGREARRRRPAPLDQPDDLVTGDDARPARREVPFRQVEVRPAHAAGPHPYEDLGRAGDRHRVLDECERAGVDRPGAADGPGPHA